MMQLDPQYQRWLPAMKSQDGLAMLLSYQTASHVALDQARAACVRRLAQRLALALAQVNELADEVRSIAAERFTPLTRSRGSTFSLLVFSPESWGRADASKATRRWPRTPERRRLKRLPRGGSGTASTAAAIAA
jgi:hypothetical protein